MARRRFSVFVAGLRAPAGGMPPAGLALYPWFWVSACAAVTWCADIGACAMPLGGKFVCGF